MNKMQIMMQRSRGEIEALVKEARGINQLKKLLDTGGGDTRDILDHLDILEIDYAHFYENRNKSRGENGRKAGIKIHQEHLQWLRDNHDRIFCENSIFSSAKMCVTIRKYNHIFHWIPDHCAECGLGREWCSKPLSLQVDHKNGIARDHRLENLRYLCPNCHSQTETFTGKNFGKRTGKKLKRGQCGSNEKQREYSESSRVYRTLPGMRLSDLVKTSKATLRYREKFKGVDRCTYRES